MDKKNNLYNYKTPKSKNEEVHFFLTKGRITLSAFLLRFLFATTVVSTFFAVYYNYALPKKVEKLVRNNFGELVIRDTTFKTSFDVFENLTFYIIPLLMSIFILIQAVKRMHDVNKSGLYLLLPLSNIILLLTKGTPYDNDYGLDPRPQKQVEYFDELNKK